ncbi:MAG: response regulator transcription factor [Bacteroidetes bacterium]|nr:response regulator transcription factor [Bacteroidota bacterium]
MGRSVRIVIADDHRMVRKAWELLLTTNKDYKVVGNASNGVEVLELLQETRVDVVLMDLDMPVMNGIATTEKLRVNYPWVKVIALTMQKDSSYIKKFLAAGASAFVTKNASEEELLKALEEVLAGHQFLSEEANEVLSNSNPEQYDPRHSYEQDLSAREKEIVGLIAGGNTTNQIADILCLSAKTIESHRRNIFKKLGVKNVAQLMSIISIKML